MKRQRSEIAAVNCEQRPASRDSPALPLTPIAEADSVPSDNIAYGIAPACDKTNIALACGMTNIAPACDKTDIAPSEGSSQRVIPAACDKTNIASACDKTNNDLIEDSSQMVKPAVCDKTNIARDQYVYRGQFDNLLFYFCFFYQRIREMYNGGENLRAYKDIQLKNEKPKIDEKVKRVKKMRGTKEHSSENNRISNTESDKALQ